MEQLFFLTIIPQSFVMKRTILFSIYLFSFVSLFSQGKKSAAKKYWEVGVFTGVAVYQGDIADSDFPIDDADFALGFSARNQMRENFAIYSNLMFTRLTGEDHEESANAARGFSFKTSLLEISVLGEYEPLGHLRQLRGGKNKFFVSPFIYSGAAVAVVTPKPIFSNSYEELFSELIKMDDKESKSATGLVFPLGMGVKFDFGKNFILQSQGSARVPFSDYVDGISQTANPDANDFYWFFGASILFKMK